MKTFAACCRICTTEPLKDGDGPMGKGRHQLSWGACVGIAHPNQVRRGLPSPAGVVVLPNPPALAGVAPIPDQVGPCRVGRNLRVGARFGFLRPASRSPATPLPCAPGVRGVYIKGIFKDGGCFLWICLYPLREPPVSTSKRPFTRRETRLAFSGRFSGLDLFGFQGTEVLVHPRSPADKELCGVCRTHGRRH